MPGAGWSTAPTCLLQAAGCRPGLPLASCISSIISQEAGPLRSPHVTPRTALDTCLLSSFPLEYPSGIPDPGGWRSGAQAHPITPTAHTWRWSYPPPHHTPGSLIDPIKCRTLNLNRILAVAQGASLEMWLGGVPAFRATGICYRVELSTGTPIGAVGRPGMQGEARGGEELA